MQLQRIQTGQCEDAVGERRADRGLGAQTGSYQARTAREAMQLQLHFRRTGPCKDAVTRKEGYSGAAAPRIASLIPRRASRG